jgi:hypothetical protein
MKQLNESLIITVDFPASWILVRGFGIRIHCLMHGMGVVQQIIAEDEHDQSDNVVSVADQLRAKGKLLFVVISGPAVTQTAVQLDKSS